MRHPRVDVMFFGSIQLRTARGQAADGIQYLGTVGSIASDPTRVPRARL